MGDPTTPITLAEREGHPTATGRSPVPHTPLPLGRAGITEWSRLCATRPDFFSFFVLFYFISAKAEVTGFDSPSVQGAGVSVSVITARRLTVTHPAVSLPLPISPGLWPGLMHSLVGTSRQREGASRHRTEREWGHHR